MFEHRALAIWAYMFCACMIEVSCSVYCWPIEHLHWRSVDNNYIWLAQFVCRGPWFDPPPGADKLDTGYHSFGIGVI